MKKIIIAIDGYSSCGKSTFAKAIAKHLNYLYLDSGAMYRAFALHCIQSGLDENQSLKLEVIQKLLDNYHLQFKYNSEIGQYQTWLNDQLVEDEIRSLKVSELVSKVSQIKTVRQKMVHLQRDMGKQKGIVMDGRDIGTVVFPHAELKIFMTASVSIRAERRYKELKEKGLEVHLDEIKKNIEQRDYQDTHRSESPLIQADDALVLDNSQLTLEDQMLWFIEQFLAITKS